MPKVKKMVEVDEVDTKEEVALVEAAVAKVEADIEAAKVKREEDGVNETEEETLAREASEKLALRVARNEVSKDEQKHLDARDARVRGVKAAIEAARVARELSETEGVTETEGAKLDREAKETKDLEEANKVNVVEPFSLSGHNNLELNLLSEKLSEVINHLNGQAR